MTDTPNLGLTYVEAAQSQKHVPVNEAFRSLDVLVQPTVKDKDLTAPPGSPANGDAYIVGAGATGAWAGHADDVAAWYDNAWFFFPPKAGWVFYVQDESTDYAYSGSAWAPNAPGTITVSDVGFTLTDNADATKQVKFELSGISTGTTRTLTVPNATGTIALLSGTQTFSGNTTFSGTLTASNATVTLGTATTATTVGLGTGAITSGVSKTVNLGTAGLSGSTTTIEIGSSVAGALGVTNLRSPTVYLAGTVLNGPSAAATFDKVGVGGATPDATNKFAFYGTNLLLNSGGSIDLTYNKNAAGNDASLSFKTGFSARAIVGTLGDDDLHFKVSPNGSTFVDALVIDKTIGTAKFAAGLQLAELSAAPAAPATGLAVYGRSRAGATWLDVMRPSGRDFPLQPHFGVNRLATWSPFTGNAVVVSGMPRTAVGTVSTPTIASTNLSTSMRRWRVTSAATAAAVADERSAATLCWRGNAAGLGGFTYINRASLVTVQADSTAFFGLLASTAALSTTATISTLVNCVGIGFTRPTDTNMNLIYNDGTGAPSQIDLGANFPIDTTSVYTLIIYSPPNGSSIFARVVNETTGNAVEYELTTDIPAATTFLSVRNYMNNGATAAAVAYDCSGVYLETDY